MDSLSPASFTFSECKLVYTLESFLAPDTFGLSPSIYVNVLQHQDALFFVDLILRRMRLISFDSCSRKTVDPSDAKELALKNAIKQLETQFGKGSVMKLGSREKLDVPVISTGSLTIDRALGIGGLPRGRVVEIYGPESSGKTTLALHTVAQLQKTGGTCTFIDAG